MNQQPSTPNQAEQDKAKEITSQLERIARVANDVASHAHEIAKSGPTVVMLTYGWVMILAAIILKVAPTIKLGTAEFLGLVIAGALLFVCAGALRIYQFKIEAEINKEIRQHGYELLRSQQTAAIESSQIGGGEKTVV
jgi:hypothetical protein